MFFDSVTSEHALFGWGLKQVSSNTARRRSQENARGRLNVFPHVHSVSHPLKKIGDKSGVRTVFSPPNKVATLCAMVNDGKDPRAECTTKHETKYVKWVDCIVYEIPLSWRRVYVDQWGRCLNYCLREHAYNMRTGTGSNLVLHCKNCKDWYHNLSGTRILKRYRDTRSREIFEAAVIIIKGKGCVSSPSVALFERDVAYLASWKECLCVLSHFIANVAF